MAPEVFNQSSGIDPYDPRAADIWSLGVILWAMLTGGKLPFRRPMLTDNMFRLVWAGAKLFEARFKFCVGAADVDPDVVDLLKNMLCPQDKRFTAEQIVRHRWLTGAPGAGAGTGSDSASAAAHASGCATEAARARIHHAPEEKGGVILIDAAPATAPASAASQVLAASAKPG